jgi:hypothetical protein
VAATIVLFLLRKRNSAAQGAVVGFGLSALAWFVLVVSGVLPELFGIELVY